MYVERLCVLFIVVLYSLNYFAVLKVKHKCRYVHVFCYSYQAHQRALTCVLGNCCILISRVGIAYKLSVGTPQGGPIVAIYNRKVA